MRGTPYFQTILMVAVFLLTGVPVYRLTRPATPSTPADTGEAVETPADNADAKPVTLDVGIVFAPAPADFQIKNLDRTVLAGTGPQARFTGHWITAVPPEGVDLVVQAHWPASTPGGASTVAAAAPAAARVTMRFPDGRTAEKSFWAGVNGTLDDVFTVPGIPASSAP